MSLKLLILPDSFKETLTARQAAQAMQRGVQKVYPDAKVEVLPFSDGGEGFTQTCFDLLGGMFHSTQVHDAVGRIMTARCLILPDGTGVMEVAEASGLQSLELKFRNPLQTTSYGSGELLKFLMDLGCQKVWIGLGGSAVNDGGAGLLQALGIQFLSGKDTIDGVSIIPSQLSEVKSIKFENIDPRWKSLELTIASDVQNPLLGPRGATYTFAKQKGATESILPVLEKRMTHWKQLMTNVFSKDLSNMPGSGAAGGIGYALLHTNNATMKSGFDLLAEKCSLRNKIQQADLILTGEGKFDATSLQGKLVGRLLQLASEERRRVLVFCGKTEIEQENVHAFGSAISMEEAKKQSEYLLEQKVIEIMNGREQ